MEGAGGGGVEEFEGRLGGGVVDAGKGGAKDGGGEGIAFV